MKAWPGLRFNVSISGWDEFDHSTKFTAGFLFQPLNNTLVSGIHLLTYFEERREGKKWGDKCVCWAIIIRNHITTYNYRTLKFTSFLR